MKSFNSIKIVIWTFQVVYVLAIHSRKNLEVKIELETPCILLFVTKKLQGDGEESGFACELQGADVVNVGPRILDVDDAITKSLESANVASGRTTLFSPNLYITEKGIEIAGGMIAIDNIVLGATQRADSHSRVEGDKTILVVRVQASDKVTSFDENALSDSVFGNINDPVSLRSQYLACSNNKLNFIEASAKIGKSASITNGVTTISVTTSISQGDDIMRNAISTKLAEDFSVSSPSQLADHVMYCLPTGTMPYMAYAYMDGWLSVFDDATCIFVSVQVHEIGHNIGLSHSGVGSNEYADTSGYMGYSYESDNFPQICFNGAKSWQLGWYSDRQITINMPFEITTFTGELVGVADYASSNQSQYVVVKVTGGSKDYYVAFNRRAGMNIDTPTGRDEVLVTHTGSWQSILVARLSEREEYIISDFNGIGYPVTISVTSIQLQENRADASVASVASVTSVATIVITNIRPTQSPTTKKPTGMPTQSPTKFPTIPTQLPTKFPTIRPTKPLTKVPTIRPTKAPTNSPTKHPTASPTRKLTAKPSQSPTKTPTTNWPTAECGPNQSNFKVIIYTDSRGHEVGYSFRQKSFNGENIGKPLMSDKSLQSDIKVTDESCISLTACYMFKIVDNGGDGICCSENTGNGMYMLLLNGELKKTSLFSRGKEMTKIGKCYISPTTAAPTSPTSPTKLPTTSPVKSPTTFLTEAPVAQICSSGRTHFKVIINTDKDGHEVKYFLVKKKFNGRWSKKKFLSGENLPSNDIVESETCISSNRCYMFKIIDSAGNGLCCSIGNRQGRYTIFLNGQMKKTSQFIKKSNEKTLIGKACWS